MTDSLFEVRARLEAERHMRWGTPPKQTKPGAVTKQPIVSVPGVQRRAWKAGAVALNQRSGASLNGLRIVGKIPYDALSYDLGGFREILAPGCFRECLAEP